MQFAKRLLDVFANCNQRFWPFYKLHQFHRFRPWKTIQSHDFIADISPDQKAPAFGLLKAGENEAGEPGNL